MLQSQPATTSKRREPNGTRQLGPIRYRIQPEAIQALLHYDWSGNVRELANVIERAQILAEDHLISLDDLPESLVGPTPISRTGGDPQHLSEVERQHVEQVLQQEKGNKVQAARALGISRRALYRLLKKHHLEGARSENAEHRAEREITGA